MSLSTICLLKNVTTGSMMLNVQQTAYLRDNGSKIIGKCPGLPRHIAASFVHCSEFSGEVTSTVIDMRDTHPLGFRRDESRYHDLEGYIEKFYVA